MTVDRQAGSLTLGGLGLMMSAPDPVGGWMIRALADGTELGDPEAVIAAIQSQLQDGDLERIDRYGNREATIPLVLEAPNSESPGDALARAAAALDAACRFDGWTELSYTSTLAGAATSVYEVTSATASVTFDDLAEMTQGCRYVTLKIHARPFPRTVNPVTIDAPSVTGSTTTTVDSGSATTGWSLLSTAPAALHNLISNPSFEVNTTGWSAGAGTASIARASTAAVGSSSLVMTESATSGRSYANSPAAVVTAGTTYQVILSNQGGLGAPTSGGGCLVRFYSDAAGTVQVGGDWDTAFASGSWATRTFTTPAAPATAVRMRIFPYGNSSNNGLGSPDVWYLDAVLVAAGAPGFYFDGSKTSTTAITYTWDGTANNSTSTATWTAPALAVVSGGVQGTVYGRASASIRRTGAVTMTSLPYMRIRGTASAFSDGLVTVADNGGSAITPASYSYNATTGAYDILIRRPTGFTTVDVTFARTGGTVSTTSGLFVNVDQIDITDNPFSTGKVQSRQVQILGSQRTELSLSVLGLDAAGTTPVALGEQVLVHTAAAGSDGRAKFLACRSASGLTGTADAGATSGQFNTLSTTATPTNFTFPASALLKGNYLAVCRVRCATVGTSDLSYRAFIDPTVGDNVFDPRTGWKTRPLTVGASGGLAAGQPGIRLNSLWVMIPLGLLRLPPADIEDSAPRSLSRSPRCAVAVDVDDIFLLNDDIGQASILLTGLASGSYSAVRLDAATVDSIAGYGLGGSRTGRCSPTLPAGSGSSTPPHPGCSRSPPSRPAARPRASRRTTTRASTRTSRPGAPDATRRSTSPGRRSRRSQTSGTLSSAGSGRQPASAVRCQRSSR
jgi:hypothetical protein